MIAAFVHETVVAVVPYALAACGGVVCERAGVANIALEGKMLLAAFVATLCADYAGHYVFGVLGAALAGTVIAWAYSACVVRRAAHPIVVGVALNLAAYGASVVLLKVVYHSASNSADTDAFSAHVWRNPIFYLVVAILGAVVFGLARTRLGLHIRAVGDSAAAARKAGVPVQRVRTSAVLLCGALCGLAGAWLALDDGRFVASMTGGRGFLAVACVIIGRWHPVGAMIAAAGFALLESIKWQVVMARVAIPAELLEALPFIVAIAVVAGLLGRGRAPFELGRNSLEREVR